MNTDDINKASLDEFISIDPNLKFIPKLTSTSVIMGILLGGSFYIFIDVTIMHCIIWFVIFFILSFTALFKVAKDELKPKPTNLEGAIKIMIQYAKKHNMTIALPEKGIAEDADVKTICVTEDTVYFETYELHVLD
jgi:hypothetical protein